MHVSNTKRELLCQVVPANGHSLVILRFTSLRGTILSDESGDSLLVKITSLGGTVASACAQ